MYEKAAFCSPEENSSVARQSVPLNRDSKLRGTRLFSSSILILFHYAYRTVRAYFRSLPIGIYIDKHVFTVP